MSTDPIRASMERLKDPANRMGVAALVVVAATAAFLIFRALPIMGAFAGGVGEAPSDEAAQATVKLYAASLKQDARQIDGRSFFFNPPPPPPPPPPPRAPEPDRPAPVYRPPPPPTSYGGPKIIGTVFDTVWFEGGKIIKVGGPVENEMRILAINATPYTVRIEWKGVPFDVSFFPKDDLIFKDKSDAPASAPVEIPPPAAEPKPAAPSTPPAPPQDKPAVEPAPDMPEPEEQEPPATPPPDEPEPPEGDGR